MPKTTSKPAKNPPPESLETASSPPSTPPKKKIKRAGGNAQDLGEFGAPPRGATHWGLRRHLADGSLERLSSRSSTGQLIVHEWPLEELTADTIARRWGEGNFRLEWIGPGGKGQRTHIAWGRDFAIQLPAAPPPSPPAPDHGDRESGRQAAPPAGSTLEAIAYMREMRALTREEMSLVNREVDGRIASLVELARVMGGNAQNAQTNALANVLERIDARLTALEGDDGEEDDDEEEAEEEEEGEEGDGRLFRPGEPIKDTIIAEAMNAVASVVKEAAPLVKLAVAEKLQRIADEAARAQTPPTAQLNGATTSSSSAASSEAVG